MAYQRVSQIQQTSQYNAKRVISSKKAARYFGHRASAPLAVTVIMYTSILIAFVLIVFRLFLIDVFFALVALICFLIIYWIHKQNPTDEEYDEWLKQREQDLLERGYFLLGFSSRQTVKSAFFIKSFVPPGSTLSIEYGNQHVYMKQGKDGNWRFSVNVYTYFIPSRYGMAIFKSDIQVFHPKRHHDERHEIYPYNFLATATTSSHNDKAVIGHTSYRYRMEKLQLMFANGATVNFSAIVKTHLLDDTDDAPYSIVSNSMFDVRFNALRALLLSGGKSTRLEP